MLLILPLLLQVVTPSPAHACFDQGPAEGMCADALLSREGGFEVWSLKPAAAAGAPIPPERARMVSGLIEAYDSHQAAFPRELLAADPTGEFCPDDAAVRNGCLTPKPLVAWPFTTYRHNRPYLMKDGRVRIEWMVSGKLTYLSMISFAGDRVRDIRTTPASMAFRNPG